MKTAKGIKIPALPDNLQCLLTILFRHLSQGDLCEVMGE